MKPAPAPPALARHPGDIVRVATGGLVTALSAWTARGNRVGLAETAVFQAVNRLPALVGPPLQVVMQAGTLGAVAVAAGLALAFRRTRLAVDVLLAGGGTWLLVKGLKEGVARLRPGGLLSEVVVRGGEQIGLGFPSGHAAVTAALATVPPGCPGRCAGRAGQRPEGSPSPGSTSARTCPWTSSGGPLSAGWSARPSTWHAARRGGCPPWSRFSPPCR